MNTKLQTMAAQVALLERSIKAEERRVAELKKAMKPLLKDEETFVGRWRILKTWVRKAFIPGYSRKGYHVITVSRIAVIGLLAITSTCLAGPRPLPLHETLQQREAVLAGWVNNTAWMTTPEYASLTNRLATVGEEYGAWVSAHFACESAYCIAERNLLRLSFEWQYESLLAEGFALHRDWLRNNGAPLDAVSMVNQLAVTYQQIAQSMFVAYMAALNNNEQAQAQ